MDKNTIIGFILIAAILIGYSVYTKPSEEEIKAQQEQIQKEEAKKQQEKTKQLQTKQKQQQAIQQNTKDTTALFFNALNGTATNVVLKNEKVELTINTKGAVVNKAVIKEFHDKDGNKNATLFDENTQNLSYMIDGKEININTSDLYFTPSNITDTCVTLTAEAGKGQALVMKYVLGKNYMLHLSMQAQGMQNLFPSKTNKISIVWNDKVKQQEKGFTFENRYATLTYKEHEGSTDHLSETSEVLNEKVEEPLDWIAFKNQFFSVVMIAKTNFTTNTTLSSTPLKKGEGFLKQYKAETETNFDPTGTNPTELEFYYGPNDFRLLQSMQKQSTFNKDLELEQLVYLGWPLFRIINRWFTLYVFDWLTGFNINMGIVLILITLLLKALTYPLVKKSFMSTAKMRVLKPKLDEATKQYNKPEDQMQKQQAMMQLYSQYGVSPLSGCLPMLIQMPIWIAMFNFVPNAIQLRGESFLWIDDLSTYDPIVEWGHNIWMIGDHLSLTCILFCASNLLYSWMMMRQQKDQMVGTQAQQMKMMQWMMMLMPLMFFFMFNDYSSGLNFYYFVSLFFSAALMWILRKTTNEEKLLTKLEANYEENKKNPKKASGLAARLEAMQKQQQEMQRKREDLNKKKNGL